MKTELNLIYVTGFLLQLIKDIILFYPYLFQHIAIVSPYNQQTTGLASYLKKMYVSIYLHSKAIHQIYQDSLYSNRTVA